MVGKTAYDFNRTLVAESAPVRESILEEFRHPMESNSELLFRILEDNKDTEYGRRYNFAGIRSIEDYQRVVPVTNYNDYSDYIDRILGGESNVLTSYRIVHMNVTASTTGNSKLVPFTQEISDAFTRYGKQWVDALKGELLDPAWMHGRTFCAVDGTFSTSDSGISIGYASSKVSELIRKYIDFDDGFFNAMFTSPFELTASPPGTDTRYLHVRFALMDRDLTGIVAGFYNLVSQMFHYIASNYSMLINDIATGTIDPTVRMSDEFREVMLAGIRPMPERAAELAEIFKNGSDFHFIPKIWPKLMYISGVGGASFSVYDRIIKERYTGDTLLNIYSGINSSEGIWTVPVGVNRFDSALVTGCGFLEFLPEDAGDDFSKIVTIDRLEVGKVYELIITNLSGLYRYRMSDAVKVTGFYERTPTVEFMYRVNRTVNMAGEKISENAIQMVVEKVAQRLEFNLRDYNLYLDYESPTPRYVFLIEPFRVPQGVTREVLRDVLFEEMMGMERFRIFFHNGRLDVPDVWWLQPESNMLYNDLKVYRGAPASQIKPVRIISNDEQKRFFFALRDMENC